MLAGFVQLTCAPLRLSACWRLSILAFMVSGISRQIKVRMLSPLEVVSRLIRQTYDCP
jgi:hypothetical protein